MKFEDSAQVYAYLNRFLNFERKLQPTEYRLDRMARLKEMFGRPDEGYRVNHVAGSKGKGSTATMLAAMLSASGRRTGLYTSPHLLSFTERIAIDGAPVDEATLTACAEELSAKVDEERADGYPGGEEPTYFELLTMLAFLCFRRAGCTDAVFEVGLGGRLDSTNVVRPLACLITPIELEHTELLGDTIAKIAAEKAGIIKPGIPVFTSAAKPDALRVIRERALELGCPLTVLDEAVELSGVTMSERGTEADARWLVPDALAERLPTRLSTPMIGSVQLRNASLAALAAASMGLGTDEIARGLRSARLRARFEIRDAGARVILDGAHTDDSIRACVDDFSRLFPGGGTLLFGCAADKAADRMAESLRSAFSEVVITRPGTFKESDPAALERAFIGRGFRVRRIDDTAEAVATAIDSAIASGLPLLVTGSFYLCAHAAAELEARRARPVS